MKVVAAVLFLVAALGGATMAVQRLRGRPIPATGLAVGHGGVAALALVLYIVAVVGSPGAPALAWWVIGLFVVAALGGAVMFLGFHLRGQPLPVPLVFIHGGVAVVGFVLLLVAILSGNGDGAGTGY